MYQLEKTAARSGSACSMLLSTARRETFWRAALEVKGNQHSSGICNSKTLDGPERDTDTETETGTAVDRRARVQIECQAKKAQEASPWNENKDVGDVVRPAPVQTGDRVPLESVAAEVAFSKLQSRILSVAETV